ncbi:lmo0937 family membrane protein [candidate division WOR-3 bacterium]|nr:lmo0937 family membrane protein [candidate division WOR-3 bacterium]
MFWAIAIVLILLWLAGLLTHIGGPVVHILLIIALGLIIYRLVKGKRIP